MKEPIQIYQNEQFGAIRTMSIEGEPWFVGKDVAEVLGYSNTRDALSKHVENDDKNTVAIHDGKGNPNQTIINESGLYSLILSSKLPTAKQFKHWVTSEILPSIRKTGGYGNIELSQVITQTAAAVAGEIIKQLAPFFQKQPKPKRKPTCNYHSNHTPSKIDLLSPEVKERAEEMLLSGKYSCQQVANYIINETGNYISVNTVTRYKREKLTVSEEYEQERIF